MSIKTSKHSPSADIGNDVPLKKGDAKNSIESQVNNLDSLHNHEADQAENQENWSDGRSISTPVGGLHSAEALSQHLENGPHGPRFAGHSKPFGKQ
jgi:hypothetical protein